MSLFYNRYIYRGKRANRPSVVDPVYPLQLVDLDKDLSKLLKVLPQRNTSNCMTAFWLDGTCQSFAYIVMYTILGKGFRIKCDDKEQEKKINVWNKCINVNGDTVEDYCIDVWIDNLVHHFSLHRISPYTTGFDDEIVEGPDLQRIPPHTITIERDVVNGWRKFVQTVHGTKTWNTPEQFLKGNSKLKSFEPRGSTVIPDHQKLVIFNSFFRKAPMENALAFIVLKYWILAFMRKYSEKMWAPLMTAYVGDEKYYPNGPQEMIKALRDTAQRLMQVKNFSASAFPGNTRVDVHELRSNGEIYLKFFEKMDQQIMFSLFSSIATRESSGVYKGNALADESTVRFMEGIRDKLEQGLKRFYSLNLLDGYDTEKIHFIWPELRTSSAENLVKVLDVAVKAGIFKDARERRRAFSQLMPFLGEYDLTDAENTVLQKEMVTMLAPSQKDETSAKAAGATKTKVKTK